MNFTRKKGGKTKISENTLNNPFYCLVVMPNFRVLTSVAAFKQSKKSKTRLGL